MLSPVPKELKAHPFTVAEARNSGLSWLSLQTSAWRRMSRGQYTWTGLHHDVESTLRAVGKRLPERAAFSGNTAAWLLGLDFSPCEPIEVTIPRDLPARARAGVRLRRASLPDADFMIRRGFDAPLRCEPRATSGAALTSSNQQSPSTWRFMPGSSICEP
jgi:hypothetical protein